MTHKLSLVLLVGILSFGAVAPRIACAQDEDAKDTAKDSASDIYTKDTWPLESTKRPITLAKGMAEIRGAIDVGLSKGLAGKPFEITPAVYYGVSDKLSVGINNDTLCLSGTSGGCAQTFNTLGVDAIFAFMQGDKNIGAHGGIQITNFADPPGLLAGLNIGVLGRVRVGKVAVVFDPDIHIGLNKRTLPSPFLGFPEIALNKESLAVPVNLWFQATPKLAVGVDTGIAGPLSGFSDFYTVPLGFDALFAVSNKLDLGGRFAFPNLGGKNSTADARALTILVNFRL